MVAKTVYDTNWKPVPITGLVFIVMAAAIIYIPYFLKVPVFTVPWVAIVCQVTFCIAVTTFFYSGISRFKQFQITMFTFAGVGFFGIIGNLFYQATYLVSTGLLTTDYVVVAIMNLAGVALTMSCYRITSKKVEVSPQDEARALDPERLAKWAPLVYALPVMAAVALMMASINLPNGASFAINLPFYVCMQIFLSFWTAFFFFKDKTRGEKIRLGFSTLAIALLLGTVGNVTQHLTALGFGMRIVLNSNQFIIMNAGAAVIVLVFVNWRKKIAEQMAKRSQLLEAPVSAERVPVTAGATPQAVAIETSRSATSEKLETPIKTEQPQDSKTV